MNFFNIVTRAGAMAGVFILFTGISGAKGAPQEAAAAAIAIALGVLPYVMFRALQITRDAEERKAHNAAVLHRLDALIEAQQNSRSGADWNRMQPSEPSVHFQSSIAVTKQMSTSSKAD